MDDETTSSSPTCGPAYSILACWVDAGGMEIPIGVQVRCTLNDEVVGVVVNVEPGTDETVYGPDRSWVVMQLYPGVSTEATDALYRNLFGFGARTEA